MRGNSGGELDPAVDDRRRCKKNFSFVYPAWVRGQKTLIMAAKMGQFTTDEQGREENLAEEKFRFLVE